MRRITCAVLTALALTGLALPSEAAVVRPPKASMTLHYVYNATQPTVEVGFKNLSGLKDVYAKGDNGIYLVAEDFNFDVTKVYDGLYYVGRVQQEDLYVTAPNAGPYGSHLAGAHTAATALPPTWYPVYDAHWVEPTPPAGSVNIVLDNLGPWWPNRD
jgi:hypothetical protein